MQKKFLAMAVAGLTSTGVLAQMNVNVTGVIDLAVTQYSGSDTAVAVGRGSQTRMDNGQGYTGSNIRFAGSEDLGSGLKFGFAIETGINADGGTGQAAPTAAGGTGLIGNRVSSLSLTSRYGTFSAGRMGNASTNANAWIYDPFGDVGPGGMTAFFTFNFKDRTSNTLQYDTPNLGGFKAGFQYAMSENQDKVAAATSGSQSTTSLTYNNGPLSLMASQTLQRDVGVAAIGAGTVPAITAAFGRKLTVNGLAGSYDFDTAKLMGQIWTEKTTEPTNAATTYNYRHWMLGVSVPVGAHNVLASYRVRDDKNAADQDAKSWTLGYNYTLSKRTTSYLRASSVSNSNSGTAGFGGGLGVAPSGTKALQAGMYHSF